VDPARDLVVDSVTGVELTLPLAGPGARSYAFIVDWLIRAILAIAWYGVAALIYNHRWSFSAPLNPDARWFVLVVTPAAVLYFLYHGILEVTMRGRTPGKRTAGIHIVTRDGNPPGVGALLTRNVFRLVDSLPLLYGIGLIATLVTRDHVRIGDMAAGTLLAYERADIQLPDLPPGSRRASDTEALDDLLQRWYSLSTDSRHSLALALLSQHGITVPPEARTDTALRARLAQLIRSSPT
jgi:uncharacterized RDD family membrane protein YckC